MFATKGNNFFTFFLLICTKKIKTGLIGRKKNVPLTFRGFQGNSGQKLLDVKRDRQNDQTKKF